MRVTALFAFALVVFVFLVMPMLADFVFAALDPLAVVLGGGK